MRRPRRGERGFTLMEIMIAAALLAMMGAILGTSISAVLGAITDNREMQDRYHAARVALGRMQREVAMAYLSKHQGEQRATKTV
ncbi:MAG: prepilin-type N-terminal cleavage/methylation domain-containing protein, partial [Myxococcales bacterium]|nr:prepilin-type N-terminal cleavage/methylation domain-containing protein [Myxococcales bacterium]